MTIKPLAKAVNRTNRIVPDDDVSRSGSTILRLFVAETEDSVSYDESLAERIRHLIAEHGPVVEKNMFGGLTFMLRGHMCCGVVDDRLMVRVGPDAYDDALAEPSAREMDFTGKPLKGMVYVDAAGVAADGDLRRWIDRAASFVKTLPRK